MVELLLLAPYLDKHLSLLEDEVLERALAAIGWSASRPDDVNLPEAFALVRTAGSCELKTHEFLVERTSILKSAGESSVAFDWLVRILGSDGLSGDESRFLTQAKSLLFD